MATLAELHDRLDSLRSIRAGGEREVQYGEDRVVFRTDAELAAAIDDLERQIATASGARPVRMVRFSTSKGI
jgi:hypothetical protein